MILYLPSVGGLKNSAPAIFMAKMFSLADSLKSLLEISVSGCFSFNCPVVGRAGDAECGVSLSDRSLGGQGPPAHVGRASRTGQLRPDLGVWPVLPPPGVASWDA
jgi:hypothetical protein